SPVGKWRELPTSQCDEGVQAEPPLRRQHQPVTGGSRPALDDPALSNRRRDHRGHDSITSPKAEIQILQPHLLRCEMLTTSNRARSFADSSLVAGPFSQIPLPLVVESAVSRWS